MIISNGYGGIVHLNVEDYLDLTDLQWQEIIAMGNSTMVDDPFYGSYANNSNKKIIFEDMEEEYDNIIENEDDILIIPLDEIDIDFLEEGDDL